jgi:hypothetical protein
MIAFLRILCCHQKSPVSLPFFGKNAIFHFAYLPKMCNSASSLNMLFTAKSAQFYSMFLPTTISLTLGCCWICEVWLTFLLKTIKTNWKCTVKKTTQISLRIFGDNARLCYALSVKTGSDVKFWITGRIWRRFLKMLALLSFVYTIDWKMQKKIITDYENLVHAYLWGNSD